MKAKIIIGITVLVFTGLGLGGYAFFSKYKYTPDMIVEIEEVSTSEYPEDPSHRSLMYDRYSGRKLRLVQKDATHFDFIFKSDNPKLATITFKNIDLGLLVPCKPDWIPEGDEDLEVIALVDREWNRQQIRFPRHSPHLEITGGDGYERDNLHTAELARNCLNAGLWEVMFTTKEKNRKALYYQGWFTLPLGQYKRVFEQINGFSYWTHWHRLEHWVNPQGRKMELAKLRTVTKEREVAAKHDPKERLKYAGEQIRKSRTVNAKNVRCWGDFCELRQKVRFATFVPPGRYQVKTPWKNEFQRIAKFDRAIVREVKSPVGDKTLTEIELVFRSEGKGEINRFIVGGFDLDNIPTLSTGEYNKGFYMPMGIGVPPFYQDYADLKKQPPHKTPYYSALLDAEERWINHHDVGIDGPVIHKDLRDPSLLHLFLLSYERHSLVGHYVLPL